MDELNLSHLFWRHPLLSFFLLIVIVITAITFIYDRFQKEHTVLRNYPVIGHFRYILESLGEYLRQYFFAMDREELPFNRAQRSWIYRASKNISNMIGFGSTRDLTPVGTVYFDSTPFPTLGEDSVETEPLTIGPYSKYPYHAPSVFNISAMSYGSLSKPAIQALARGAKMAGCWINTGEGGVSPYHLEAGADVIAQIGTAKYGFRDEHGKLSDERLKEIASHENVRMFEIKISQGAKPGKGGILPAIKVTPEIAKIRGIPAHRDSISPNRFPEIKNVEELLDFITHIKNVTEKPVGVKLVLGSYDWLHDFCKEILKRGVEFAPDFIALDSADGGTGASPMTLVDYMGLPIYESLIVLVDTLIKYNLRERIKIIATGKLVTPGMVAWALCAGADFINSARGFMFSLGCIQSLRCHKNTCPTGIATHNKYLQNGLNVDIKSVRVANYVKNMVEAIGNVAHSCGVREPRELTRHHARMVTANKLSVSLDLIYPEAKPGELL